MTDPRYHYRCHAIGAVDGDTLDLNIDLGFDIRMRMRVRLSGINAPDCRSGSDNERRAGEAAYLFVKQWCWQHIGKLMAHTQKDKADKSGRMLVTLYDLDTGETLQDAMIKAGHAVAYDGQTARMPWGSA
jgi:endonuclease YncB( thermonuclease family)